MAACTDCAALQRRIDELEARLAALQSVARLPVASTSSAKSFDFSTRTKRKIALKFSYEGWHYGGLAIQNTKTPLPTIEEKLVDALVQGKLVESRDLEAMGFARCGRTDRGVSAAGQVVSLWVRSALPAERLPPDRRRAVEGAYMERVAPAAPIEDTEGELQYDHILNRLLPPSIRILAWSPVDERFDARFSCSGRHYKYFFSSMTPHAELDIEKMREAAARLVGEHDFRNFCKLDGAKQIVNYLRRVDAATITETGEREYVFDLRGSAFLWHQVRHIVAILFHVGVGLEAPSIVSALLDVETVPSRPAYEMASDLPLLLWDCFFPAESVRWRTSGGGEMTRRGMATTAEEHRMKAVMAQHHLHALDELVSPSAQSAPMLQKGAGDVQPTPREKYKPLLERERGLDFEEVNRRWREGPGARKAAARKETM